MNRNKIIIGSRGSKLALIYAERVKENLSKFSDKEIEIKTIITQGDTEQVERISEVGGKGVFIKNIEESLLSFKIDLAVHALKDMPSVETKGLMTDCFLKRNDANEILITKNKKKIEDLDANSIIGTSSFRREYQLKKIRSDLNFKIIRGNVDTRVKKVKDGIYDAVVLSKAGIKCLNLKNEISQEFSLDQMIPCAGQGVVAIQCRSADTEIINLLKKINDEESKICATAEREVLKTLDGDCSTALGVNSIIDNDVISISAELFSMDGKKRYYFKSSKKKIFAKELGREIGLMLMKKSNGDFKE